MKKIIIKVEEDKTRIPKYFVYNKITYTVKDATMTSYQTTPLGNRGIKVVCKVEGQKHDVMLWLDGSEWFVEF